MIRVSYEYVLCTRSTIRYKLRSSSVPVQYNGNSSNGLRYVPCHYSTSFRFQQYEYHQVPVTERPMQCVVPFIGEKKTADNSFFPKWTRRKSYGTLLSPTWLDAMRCDAMGCLLHRTAAQ
mmetsp:Transcript_19413/g.42194  ORF Transcript_19413/g.42194 Transcript_19413/m.42194 type:complete len:120 (+) Transcript_19413:70-429(+)